MARVFGCFSQFQLSPQLRIFEPVSEWIDGLARYHIADRERRLNEVGRQQYALELVSRERVWISCRSKESRYRYRTKTDIGDRAKIAARFNTLIFFERLPNKPATATVQQYELDALVIREKNARLRALRLAQPKPPKRSNPKRKDKWRNTLVTTPPAKSLRLRCPHLPQKQQETFVRKSFSPSATFAELHCSTI